MTIFLAGASGLVGSAFARTAARRGHRVIGTVGAFAGELAGVAQKLVLDLTNEAAVHAAVADAAPAAIVNCAAVSVPEQCDADPALSQALNVTLPAAFARLAQQASARFVHLSSEQAFDGARSTPYRRDDPVAPINLYGRQKVESERLVQAAAPELAVTLRAPLLMGNSAAGQRSLHERMLADWVKGRTPRLFTDEFRQPCTAENLAEAMLEVCERKDFRGVYHWGGAELVSRYALGVKVREHFGLTAERAPLAAVTRAEVPGAAQKRQACLALELSPLVGALRTRPQTIAEQVRELRVPEPCREWYSAQT